jgi:hypothetical protein
MANGRQYYSVRTITTRYERRSQYCPTAIFRDHLTGMDALDAEDSVDAAGLAERMRLAGRVP